MQPNDGELLVRFLQNRDEFAFEELVKRHASMVMTLCRRALGDARDAEEAFQNTFLVLIRKAEMHRQADSIGGWLYDVATRTALDIRGQRLTQASRFVEQEEIEMIPQTEESISTAWEAMKGLLDEELVQLADKYRRPLILCYLEGKAPDEAAADLSMNHNTFRIRLMRGRELLRKRLVRRGVVVSANLLGTVLLEQVAQSAEVVSEVLIQSTVKAASALLSTAAGVSAITAASKLTLLKGIVMTMIYKKTALVIGGLVLLGILGSIVYWNKGEQKNQRLPAIVAHKQVEKPSETLTTQTGTTEQISDSVEKITLPKSIDDFLKRFAQGLKATGAEKWKIWQQLGIGLTDEEFEAA